MSYLHFQKSAGLIKKVDDMSLAKAIYIFQNSVLQKDPQYHLEKKRLVNYLLGMLSRTYYLTSRFISINPKWFRASIS